MPGIHGRADRYLARLDELTGSAEARLLPVPSTHDGIGDLTVVAFRDVPEDLQTSFTYGVSLADHEDWTSGKPELCLSVRSTDGRWAQALGLMAENLRGRCPFRYNDVIRFEAPIAPESEMSAFLVFASTVLPPEATRLEVGPPGREDSDVIQLHGVYPIHESEAEYLGTHGLESFWRRDWDRHDVTRPPAV